MNVKVGDKVLVKNRWSKSIQTVEKITPKGSIRVSNGRLYDSMGLEKNNKDYYSRTTIIVLTQEVKEQLRREELVDKIIKVMHDVQILSYDQALKIMEILNSK